MSSFLAPWDQPIDIHQATPDADADYEMMQMPVASLDVREKRVVVAFCVN